MIITLFLKGFLIGFSIASTIGPIAVLCINRSIHDGWKQGFATGFGAASADCIYGIIAGFGLTFISSFLLNYAFWIKSAGGIFLIYLGWKTLTKIPPKQLVLTDTQKSSLHAYLTSFFLTMTNPLTIISFMAVFAGLGIGSTSKNYLDASLLIFGIVIGSLLGQSYIIILALLLKNKIKRFGLYWINFISGLIIICFGLYALYGLIK